MDIYIDVRNKRLFLSIRRAKNCLFSRRNGYQGILMLGYSIYFKIIKIERL